MLSLKRLCICRGIVSILNENRQMQIEARQGTQISYQGGKLVWRKPLLVYLGLPQKDFYSASQKWHVLCAGEMRLQVMCSGWAHLVSQSRWYHDLVLRQRGLPPWHCRWDEHKGWALAGHWWLMELGPVLLLVWTWKWEQAAAELGEGKVCGGECHRGMLPLSGLQGTLPHIVATTMPAHQAV